MRTDFILAPLLESAERFAAAARSYLEGIQIPGPAAAQAARVFSDFLRVETLDLFRLPWTANPQFGDSGAAFPPAMQDIPAFGLTREHQLRWQRSAASARRIADAQHRLQLLWSDALRDAAVAFAARLDAPPVKAAKDTVPDGETLRGLYDAWIDCAEVAYAHIAHGDSFSSALADFMNASSAWRKESQANLELWSKGLDLPTRSELNTLMRRVNSLDEQLRLVEEQLRIKEPQAPPPAKPPRGRRPPRAHRGKRP